MYHSLKTLRPRFLKAINSFKVTFVGSQQDQCEYNLNLVSFMCVVTDM